MTGAKKRQQRLTLIVAYCSTNLMSWCVFPVFDVLMSLRTAYIKYGHAQAVVGQIMMQQCKSTLAFSNCTWAFLSSTTSESWRSPCRRQSYNTMLNQHNTQPHECVKLTLHIYVIGDSVRVDVSVYWLLIKANLPINLIILGGIKPIKLLSHIMYGHIIMLGTDKVSQSMKLQLEHGYLKC